MRRGQLWGSEIEDTGKKEWLQGRILRKERKRWQSALQGWEARLPPTREGGGTEKHESQFSRRGASCGKVFMLNGPCDVLGEKFQYRIVLRMQDAQNHMAAITAHTPTNQLVPKITYIKHSVQCLAHSKSAWNWHSYYHYHFTFTEATCRGWKAFKLSSAKKKMCTSLTCRFGIFKKRKTSLNLISAFWTLWNRVAFKSQGGGLISV